ncbi:MAG: PHP domain-containing protein [Bacillota bacterium]
MKEVIPMGIYKKFILLIALLIAGMTFMACESENTVLALNPYEDVDFETADQALTNLHTHTKNSDGNGTPHDVVDYYEGYGYDTLALTDHDTVTYPWTFSTLNDGEDGWEDRDPDALGMLAVEGNELTVPRNEWFPDTVSLFTDYEYQQPESLEGTPEAFHNTLDEIDEIEDSLAFIAHPGREWKTHTDYADQDMYSIPWWVDLFNDHPKDQLIGLEVFNRNDQYRHDRGLWDEILLKTMPERPVWGLGNDDYHGDGEGYIHRSFTRQLIEGDFTEDALRESLRSGHFFTSNVNNSDDDAPRISNIIVDEEARTITIEGSGYDTIEWFHGSNEFYEPTRIAEGETFEYGSFEGNYVRARLIKDKEGADEGKTLTQPFGFTQEND